MQALFIEYNGDMSNEQLFDMIENLKNKYDLDINGSEPLLNTDYLKFYKMIGQNRILTNGEIIYKNIEILSTLKSNNIKWICISHHFSLQKFLSNINIDNVKQTFQTIKSHGFSLELMTTITQKNYKDIELMVIEAIALKADCIRFTNLFNSGMACFILKNELLTRNQIYEFFDLFYAIKDKYKDLIKVRRSGTFSKDDRKYNSRFNCPAGVNRVAITPDNSVYPCPFLTRKDYKIGNYVDGKIIINKKLRYDENACCLIEKLNFNNQIILEVL